MPLILELGSGCSPTFVEGAKVVHLDRIEAGHVEIVADLANGIPLPSNVFDEILAYDVVEHLDDVVAIMDEMHRTLKPDGVARIRVPEAGSENHLIDPTHRRGFTLRSFDYFDDGTELGARHGAIYTRRRWRLIEAQAEGGNCLFLLQALKPGEEPRSLPDLFGDA